MTPRITYPVLLAPVCVALWLGSVEAQNANSAANAEGIDYAKWTALTDKPIRVNEHLFTRCEAGPATEKTIKELRKEQGPHFVGAIKLFVNAEAEKALKGDPKAVLPIGGKIVKEKLSGSGKDARLVAYGAMIKREKGYDAAHGDWEYMYADLSGAKPKIERGKIDSCIQCHRVAKEQDYLFRTYLGNGDKK